MTSPAPLYDWSSVRMLGAWDRVKATLSKAALSSSEGCASVVIISYEWWRHKCDDVALVDWLNNKYYYELHLQFDVN